MFQELGESRAFVTHPSLYIRNTRDALVILEAVRLNMLPLIKRRLFAAERDCLTSGNVFVWEEGEEEGGLLRWTDGRRWSQSRMRGDYLIYEEKIEITPEEKEAKAARRARRLSDPSTMIPPAIRRRDRPSKPDGLTKQTYSALVYLPGMHTAKKWHVVAYVSEDDFMRLPVIENYDYLRHICIPDGVFVNSKSAVSRIDLQDSPESGDEVIRKEPRRSIEKLPAYPYSDYPLSSPPSSSPPSLFKDCGQGVALPPFSALDYPPVARSSWHGSGNSIKASQAYAPLCSEDRRALRRLRINL